MSTLWQKIESGKVPAFWNDGCVVHACEGAKAHEGIFLMWTKCQRDVPAGKAHVLKHDQRTYGDDTVTCQKCLGAERQATAVREEEERENAADNGQFGVGA